MAVNPDFRDLFAAFNDVEVRYLVVGAYAVTYHSRPRYTKDLDVWVDPAADNAQSVWQALAGFGAPLSDVTVEDFSKEEMVFQIGVEPNRIDILMGIDGVAFREAWNRRVESEYGGCTIHILSREDLIANKKATGRPHDLEDLRGLGAAPDANE